MYLGVKFLFVLTLSPRIPPLCFAVQNIGGPQMPQDIEEAVKGKSTIKLLLVVLAIGAVLWTEGLKTLSYQSVLYRIYPFLPPCRVSLT